jgi:hypothetical protein
MKKVYEREWFYHEAAGEIRDREYPDRWIDFSDDEEAGRLAAAAPKMARALLVVMRSGVNSSWISEDSDERIDMQKIVRAAARDAGLPLTD